MRETIRRHASPWLALAFVAAGSVAHLGCSSNSSGATPADASTPGSGGATSSGGVSASGGATSSGGVSASGGATSSGGVSASGGATSTGGVSASGGATSTGGVSASGGATSTGDSGTSKTIDHLVTFYGWPDNDPPGAGIAYPKLHQQAGGTGTYADPITFATDPKEWTPGTILYLPYLERYVIMEDSCAECITDWAAQKHHIDIWLDSDGRLDSQVIDCEDTLTRSSTPVEIDPPSNRPVNAAPLFDSDTGMCNAP